MKVKRKDWEELNARVAALEVEIRETRRLTLMETKTGPLLLNVAVPMILAHLKVETVHGLGWLQPLPVSESETHSSAG